MATKPERFDILILGSGAGGKLLARHIAQSGRRTAVVEREWIGGSCPNIACLPSKNEIWSAKVAHTARHAADFGTMLGPISIDMAKVRQRKRDMVKGLVAAHVKNYEKSGVELILGSGRFVDSKTLQVELKNGDTRLVTGEKVFINVGTHAAIPNIPGLAAAQPLTHIEALEVDYLPSHLIVLGGGYVGIELAQAYRRFGSRVTIIERGHHILSREDGDVADELQQVLTGEGIEIITGASPVDVKGQSGKKVTFVVRTASGERTIEGSDILVATGRIPNTAGIGLEEAGVKLDDRGYIRVNDRLETSAPDVWAIGECAGSPQFTHVSVDDFMIIKDNLAGGKRSTSKRLVPYCLFTDPQVAHVGLSENEAKRQGVGIRVAKLPMTDVLRTATTGETKGFMKALVSESDDRILGFTMVGAEAGEVMAIVQMAMLGQMPFTVLRDAILTHPTMAEGLGVLFSKVPPRAKVAAGTAEMARSAKS
jgi:pyruvate/2-oxoglutarate dehydrogenase complex dihydrolipoamide dehydrogenase (E3) component